MKRRRLILWIVPPATIALVTATLFVACNGGGKSTDVDFDVGPPLPEVAQGPNFFEDVTQKTGIKFQYRNGEESKHMAILESLGGGGCLIDFDKDGKLDLFVCGGGYYDKDDD